MSKNSTLCRLGMFVMITLLIFASSNDAKAFNQIHARALALGGAHAANAQGIETVGWNPAFMAFSDQYAFTIYSPITVTNIGFRLSNDFLSLDQVDKYFVEDMYWDASTKQAIMDEVVGDEWDFYTDFYIPVLGFSFRTQLVNIAINYDIGFSADWRFSKQFMDLALNGLPLEDQGEVKDFGDTAFRTQAASRIAFSVAKRFDEIASEYDAFDEITAGFTFSYYLGHGYANTETVDGILYMDSDSLLWDSYIETVNAGVTGTEDSTDYDPLAGNGVGLDIGIGTKMMDGKLTLGFSVINLVNSINYSGAQRRIYSLKLDEAPSLEGLNNIDDWLDKTLVQVDSLAGDGEQITVHVPTVMHLNAGYQLNRKLWFGGNFRAGLNSAPGGSKNVRVGVGTEYKPVGLVPLRLGFSLGGRGGFTIGAGFGLHFGFWHTDFGWAWERGFANSANGLHFAWNTAWFFGKPSGPEGRSKDRERLTL